MALTKRNVNRPTYEPDYAVPPGRTLQETIEALGIDQRELANRSGISAKHINQIINGIAPITHETAIRLERVTGVAAGMWNNLEANYREQLARIQARQKLEADLKWLQEIPTKELVLRVAIKQQHDEVSLLEEVLRFFGVADVSAWRIGWEMPQFAFRKSMAVKGKVGALATWLRLCELKAQRIDCQTYDRAKFRSALDAIRDMTTFSPSVFASKMVERCAEAGVALTLVPEIKNAPVSGAAKWITPDKAMIGLNLRGKSNDRFWFTFFHEAGHILNDSKKETFVDVEYEDDPREHGANEFAAHILIPPRFEADLPQLKSFDAVRQFADAVGIAPGIVVGRLQREGIVKYSHLNSLKVRLDWAPG